jgi:hypothetical protein
MKQWWDFFGSGELMPLEQIERHYPNARRYVRGGVFVSHAGVDGPKIDALITKSLRSKYNPYAVFQYSAANPAKEHYKHLVLLAMNYCACAIVACSERAIDHEWVFAEVDWLLDHGRPLFLLCLDDTPPTRVHPGLALMPMFQGDQAQQLEQQLHKFNIPQFPDLNQ